jgi:VIT1/CCC1 family predicted Fe2+/Mn2+ transporter
MYNNDEIKPSSLIFPIIMFIIGVLIIVISFKYFSKGVSWGKILGAGLIIFGIGIFIGFIQEIKSKNKK